MKTLIVKYIYEDDIPEGLGERALDLAEEFCSGDGGCSCGLSYAVSQTVLHDEFGYVDHLVVKLNPDKVDEEAK